MLGNDKEWEVHCMTLFRVLAGRNLIYVKEDYGKYDENPERESQIESQLKPRNCGVTWKEDEHSDDSINELHKKMCKFEAFTQSIDINASLPVLEGCDDGGFAEFESPVKQMDDDPFLMICYVDPGKEPFYKFHLRSNNP